MSLIVDIKKRYRNFTLSVRFETTGNAVGILGASGCGKSLTLKSIAGIITPDEGRIVLNDKVLYDSDKRINLPPQKRKVGYLFQNYALFPTMTVEQNIGAGIQEQKNKKADIIRKMIETFCLSGLERHYPVQLSGGEQQRVALARILASDTELLLLDEPFSALDYYLREQMIEQLYVLMKGYQKDVILVTHDRDEAFSLCPDLIIMDNGRLICQGDLKEIFAEPKTLTAARLTGCKNFSKAVKVSEHELFASDWNLTLWVEQIIPDSINYIGIRAHYLKSTVSSYDCRNLIEPELVEVIESPFEVNVLFINKKINKNRKDYQKIWWKLSKEEWYGVLKCTMPAYISIPTEHILLFNEY